MTFPKVILCFTLLFPVYVTINLYVKVTHSNVSLYLGTWDKSEDVYSTSIAVEQETEFCLCPAYQCETMMEATLLASPTIWGWRHFLYFSDPGYPTPDRAEYLEKEWPKSILTELGHEYCLSKSQGDTLVVTMKERGRYLRLNIY